MKKFYLHSTFVIITISQMLNAASFEKGAYRFETNADEVDGGTAVTLLGYSYQVNQQTADEVFSTSFFEDGSFDVDGVTYVLTRIADNAFAYAWQHKFSELTIPATVKRVGANAFAGAFDDSDITYDDYMTYKAVLNVRGGEIGGGAFQNNKFKRVVVDGSQAPVALLFENWQSSFANSRFAYLSIDGDVTMAEKQFQNCGVAYVHLNCKEIPDYAFSNAGFANGYAHWTFGEDIERIGVRAFENLQNGIGDLVLPCKNVIIDEYAFYNSKLTSIECTGTFDGTIGANAFDNNASLSKVSIYGSSIGAQAFNNCVNLKTVVFGPKLRFIGSEVLYECRKVQDIFVGIEMVDGVPQVPVCAPGAFYGVGYDVDIETAANQKKVQHPGWVDAGFGDWGNILYDVVKVHVAPYVRDDSGYYSSVDSKTLALEVIEVMRNTECSVDEAHDATTNSKGFLHQGWDRDWEKAFYCYRDHNGSDLDMQIYDKPCGGTSLGNSPYQVGNFMYVVATETMNDVINNDEIGAIGEQVLINIPIEEFIFNSAWQEYVTQYNNGMEEDLGMHIVLFFKKVRDDAAPEDFSGVVTTNLKQMASQTMMVADMEDGVDVEVDNVEYSRNVMMNQIEVVKSGVYNSYTGVNEFIRGEYGDVVADLYKQHWSLIGKNGVYRDCRSEVLCIPNDENKAWYYSNAVAEFHTDYEVLDGANYEKHSVEADEELYYISFYAPELLREKMISYLTDYMPDGRKRSRAQRSNLTMNNGLWIQMPSTITSDDAHYVYKNMYIEEMGIVTGVEDEISTDAIKHTNSKYYNTSGVLVTSPQKGSLVIKVEGSNVEKVFIK